MPYYGFFWDPTYILVIIGAMICAVASARVNGAFRRYSGTRSRSGLTGAEAAAEILRSQGIEDVRIQHISGNLTDHYDPGAKVLRLSDSVYGSTSLAAVGVAAHECGHAVQHARGYLPLSIRTALVPAANIGSSLCWPLIIIGLLIGGSGSSILIRAGILLFCLALLFQIVTLPVEFNASHRALILLQDRGILSSDEIGGARAVLRAAALTYVAGVLSSILQLLRLILIANSRNDR